MALTTHFAPTTRWSAIALALAAGACFALASALQHRAAASEERHRLGDPRLIARLARRPAWQVANLADLVAVGLQTLALRFGPLTLVQPLLVSGLLLTIPVEAALNRRPMRFRDLLGATVGTAALGIFLLAAATTPGRDSPPPAAWILPVALAGAAGCACLLASRRVRGDGRAALLGTATGILYGITAALLKACSADLDHPLTLITHWYLYALIGVGVLGFILNQNVFQHGSLAAGIVALSIAEPVIAFGLGLTVFAERLNTTAPQLGLLILAALGLLTAIWLTSTARRPRSTP